MLATELFLTFVLWKCCFDRPATTLWGLFCIFIYCVVVRLWSVIITIWGDRPYESMNKTSAPRLIIFCQCEPYNFQNTANYHDPGSVASVKTEHNRAYVWSKCVLPGTHKRCLSIISQECGVIYAACEQDLKKRDNWLTWQTSLHPLPVLKYWAASRWSLIVPVQAHSMD